MALREPWRSGDDGHLSREAPGSTVAKLLTGTEMDRGQNKTKDRVIEDDREAGWACIFAMFSIIYLHVI